MAAFADHLPVLTVLSPLIGLLIWFVSVLKFRSLNQGLVLGNALLTLILAIFVFSESVNPPQKTQLAETLGDRSIRLVTKLPWFEIGPVRERDRIVEQMPSSPSSRDIAPRLPVHVTWTMGVDGYAVLAILWIVAVSWGGLCCLSGEEDLAKRGFLLWMTALALGWMCVVDLTVAVLIGGAWSVSGGIGIGLWGGAERRRVAPRYVMMQSISLLLQFWCWVQISTAHAWMRTQFYVRPVRFEFLWPAWQVEIPRLIESQIPILGMWDHGASTIAIVLLISLFFQWGLVPFHHVSTAAHQHLPRAFHLFLTLVPIWAGFLTWLRIGLPLFQGTLSSLTPALLWLVDGSFLALGLLTLGQSDYRRMTSYLLSSACCLVFRLTLSGSPLADLTAILFLFFSSFLFLIIEFGLDELEASEGAAESDLLGGLVTTRPGLALLMILALCGVSGTSLLIGLVLNVQLWMVLISGESQSLMMLFLGEMLIAWGTLNAARRMAFGHPRPPTTATLSSNADVVILNTEAPSEALGVALIPTAIILAVLVVFPQLFIARLRPAISASHPRENLITAGQTRSVRLPKSGTFTAHEPGGRP